MKNPIILLACFLIAVASNAQVGIGTTSPNSTLDVQGTLAAKTTITSNTSTSLDNETNFIYTGASAASVTLPTAFGITGRMYTIKNASSGAALTVNTTSSQTIDGTTSQVLGSQNQTITVVSNGTNWNIIGYALPSGSSTNWSQGGNAVSGVTTLGTTTDYSLPFITNNTERMRLTSTGLGIGTTSPTEKLQVDGNLRLSGTDRAIFFDATGDPYAGIKTVTRTNETTELMLFAGNDVTSSWGADRIRLASHQLHFATSSSTGSTNSGDATAYYSSTTNAPTRMLINENGNVAIGTTNFDGTDPEKFLIDAGSTSSRTLMAGYGEINDYLQVQISNQSSGNNASTDFIAAADNASTTANYIDIGINSSSYTNSKSNILNGFNTAYLYAVGQHFYIGNGTPNKDVVFFTNTGSAGVNTANGTERMRITSAGLVPGGDGAHTLGTSANRWSVVYAANGTIQTSDKRLKTNIRTLKYGLKEVMAMQPVSYNWVTAPSNNNKIGLLAQDVKALVPEVVIGDESKENLGMNYAELVPVLINAIKEQQQQIDQLKKKVKALENK